MLEALLRKAGLVHSLPLVCIATPIGILQVSPQLQGQGSGRVGGRLLAPLVPQPTLSSACLLQSVRVGESPLGPMVCGARS